MESVEKQIEQLTRFRDDYFIRNPTASGDERCAAVREMANPMIQDIPIEAQGIPAQKAQHHLMCGRVLNVCLGYEARCEEYLSKAVKLDPSLADAWYELGECLWKKPDRKGAVNCFQRALAISRTAQTLCSLSMGLRSEMAACSSASADDAKKRSDLLEHSSALAEEAVTMEPESGPAWHAVGNARLARFFARAQNEPEMLGSAMTAYEKALTLGREERNADLHFNYSQALRYDQRYAEAVNRLRRATELDPAFPDPRESLSGLISYLSRTQQSVRTKGKLKAKRLAEVMRSIAPNDFGMYSSPSLRLADGRILCLKKVKFSDLDIGVNRNRVISGRVVGIVPNMESIPYTFTACDSEGTCLAFAVFNFAPDFGVVIGDAIACPEPFVIDVKIDDGVPEKMDFRMVRIPNPSVMIHNGKKVGANQVAFCDIRYNSKPTGD